MSLIDLYYRAFKSFRKDTLNDLDSRKLRRVIASSHQKDDKLTSTKYECEIEEDWIENIEEGLVYIEKAIREDRQFIRTEGEVVQIEKVKKVSKASIEHLSRHSDLITRIQKDNPNDIIPEKLYVVEKLNDYLVYENRFIYMLLCYLKDFIQIRLDAIKDKTTSFTAHMEISKELDRNQRHLNYQLLYDDVYKNDPLLVKQYSEIPLVDRVENIYAIAVSLLSTSLMKEVSKAPLIKPPVVKTNVLRMNQNFRASLKLYDFITSYNKNGYTFIENKKTFNPFPADMADEIAESIQLTSFIAYMVGNDIREDLEEGYKTDEKKLIEAHNKKIKDDIKRLKKRIVEMNEDPSEYILTLEKRNITLEKDSAGLANEQEKNSALTKDIEAIKAENFKLEESITELSAKLKGKKDEINTLNQKYFDDMTLAEDVHQSEIKNQEELHNKNIERLNKQHEETIRTLKEEHTKVIDDLSVSYEGKITSINDKHTVEKQELKTLYQNNIKSFEVIINQLKENVDDLKVQTENLIQEHAQEIDHYDNQLSELKSTISKITEEKRFANAQYVALKKQQGLMKEEDDFTSKERFKQLELEMNAYKKLFKEEWKKAKSQIREKVKEDTFTNKQSTD